MTFEEILQQTVAILQSRGRVSYRALKRQFNLDDDYLDDLKAELLYVYPQVVDDDRRGLAWPGEKAAASTASATPSPIAGHESVREPRAWPLLEQALSTPAPAPTSVEALRLRDYKYELHRTAVIALVDMPDSIRVRHWLARLLKDRDPKVRAEATRVLGMRGDTHNAVLLCPACNDTHPEVRWEAIRAVGVMHARAAGTAVLQALHDSHPRVVAEAAQACAALQETQAIPRLEMLLLLDPRRGRVGGRR